jgi:hypothetical protein
MAEQFFCTLETGARGMSEYLPWVTLALLGAYHGLNPGMGWLFAVALGLQERRRAAVLGALTPIALGHALSVAAVVALVALAQTVISARALELVGGLALLGFGAYKLLRPLSHPRWVGMRVNFADLTGWSFLMATAHGAGLMLAPVLLRLSPEVVATAQAHGEHGAHGAHGVQVVAASGMPLAELGALGLHSAAMFMVMALVAVVVYEKVGLAVLRRAWFNLDLLWALALVGAGVLAIAV